MPLNGRIELFDLKEIPRSSKLRLTNKKSYAGEISIEVIEDNKYRILIKSSQAEQPTELNLNGVRSWLGDERGTEKFQELMIGSKSRGNYEFRQLARLNIRRTIKN